MKVNSNFQKDTGGIIQLKNIDNSSLKTKNYLERLTQIAFAFFLFQLSLTSIFIYLEPKLYTNYHGFHFTRNSFLFLMTSFLIFSALLLSLRLTKNSIAKHD